jgi:hypothetical protein
MARHLCELDMAIGQGGPCDVDIGWCQLTPRSLGHQLMPGAQLRYFVRAAGHIVAASGFGASPWEVKPRDQLIGWTTDRRQRNSAPRREQCPLRHPAMDPMQKLGLAHPRLVSGRLPDDWQARYAYRPVLIETFVEKTRFTGIR